MALGGTQAAAGAQATARSRGLVARASSRARELDAPALGAIGVTALFIALTCWWLSQDSAMPYSDAAVHLNTAFRFHDQLAEGNLLGPFEWGFIYAPLTPLVGSLGIFAGGRNVAAPIVTENLIYVPLLAVACYCTAQRAFGSPAGLLAVVFALGSPLIIEQFHVFMIDAPLAAMVAATVWLVLASDRFRRVDLALVAGVVAGLGLISKQTFPLYVAGLVLVVLARGGGWRNWRGFAAFLGVAAIVGLPWYGYHASNLDLFLHAAGGAASVPPLAKPPLLSTANLGWYFFGLANGLLFMPLLAFALVGLGSAAVATVRRPAQAEPIPELLLGGLAAWLAITAMEHKDVRYTLPLIVYLAVLGTGWIVHLRATGRLVAVTALALAVVATTLGATFGVGASSSALLPGNRLGPDGEGVMPLNTLTLYSNHNFMVSGPRDGGDFVGLLKAMKRDGVKRVVWFSEWAPPSYVDFNNHGLIALTRVARMRFPTGTVNLGRLEPREAVLIPERRLDDAPPCVRLSDGVGVWIRLGNPWARGARDYCPRFEPRIYGP